MARHDLRRASLLHAALRFWLALFFIGVVGSSLPAAAQSLPSARIGTSAFISPSAAESYYSNLGSTHTNGLSLQRAAEVRELARALRYDVDLIYQFVRNHVETEWTYGLHKGALGTYLDRSGNSYDQAQLMVELVREAAANGAPYSASYRAGTITLTGAQFAAWSNITNADAACQLLSSGGIPAAIDATNDSQNNPTTVATCAYSGAAIVSITLSHVWVAVAISGTTYLFDPSYKTHAFIAGINLNSTAGLDSGEALSSATTGMSTGTSWVRNLNSETLTTTLQSYGAGLLTYMEAHPEASMEDIVGGGRIVTYEGTLRQTSYSGSSEAHNWTEIPDGYRSTLRVELRKLMADASWPIIINCTATPTTGCLLYADEIYGRKLIVDTLYTSGVVGGEGPMDISLRLREEANDVAVIGTYNGANQNVLDRNGTITLVANLPYAADGAGGTTTTGTYMDTTLTKPVYMMTSFTIVNAWGDVGSGQVESWGQRDDAVLPRSWSPACETCMLRYRANAGDARREQLAINWMAQASRAASLHAAIGRAIYTQHYALGVVVGDAQPRTSYYHQATGRFYYTIVDNFDRVDVDDGFSYTSRTANAGDRRAGIFAVAATRDALEAGVPGQISDLPDTSATATRFDWGNRPPSAEDPSNNYGPRRFYQFNSANISTASTVVVAEGLTSSSTGNTDACGGEEPLSTSENSGRRNRLITALTQYANASFEIVASEESFLGPGQRRGAFYQAQPAGCGHYDSMQRGGAFVAVRSVNGEPVEIAHITVGTVDAITGGVVYAKGGGGGVQPVQDAQYDPSAAADVLRARFVDRANAVGVDLNSGAVTYASPAGISVGNGEFPYRLSANLIWRGGFVPSHAFGPDTHTQPSTPWTSNWHNMLSVSASGMEAMGQSDIRGAAGTIGAFMAQQDVYRASYSPQREAAALLVAAWQLRQTSGNVVTVNVGADTRQFVRNVNDQWFSPGGGAYATLTQTGQRTALAYQNPTCADPIIDYIPTRGWRYNNVSFVVTNANGDAQNFGYWETVVPRPTDGSCLATPHGFRMSSWVFPQGVTVNVSYASIDEYNTPVITQVSNNLGRTIRFTYTGNDTTFRWTGYDNGLSGGDARATTIAATGGLETITGVTDAMSAQTRFTTATVGTDTVLTEVYDANDSQTVPSLRYAYDTIGRVKEVQDAVALQVGGRDPYEFRIVSGARGEREDPLGGRYTVLSNIYDGSGVRSQRYIDEINRSTTSRSDGRGRLTAYIYPELDEERLTYDARNRVTEFRRCAKSGCSPSTDIVIGATWNDTWNRVARIIDARGCYTDFVYGASGASAGQMTSATRPGATGSAPCTSGTRPVYSFTYGSFGRVATSTDPTGVVTSNAINATTGNISSTTLDPSGVNATTSFTYDAQGDVATAIDPRTNATSNSYDAMRRPTLVRRHDGGTGATLLAAEQTIYNSLGQVTSTEGGTAFSGTNVTTWLTRESRTYTPTGQVATVTNGAGNISRTCYDGLDRAYRSVDPVGRARVTVFDAAGQATEVQAWWSASTSDATCTLTSTLPGGQTTRHLEQRSYTQNGQVDWVDDANNNRSNYTYDGFDRLIRLEFPVTTIGQETPDATNYEAYTYDASSNRLSLRLRSGDADTINYGYDNLNRQTSKDIPGGATADVTYAYDLAGRRNSALFTSGGQGIVYGYDTAGRLTSETSFGRALSYQYDSASNRTRLTWPDSNYAQYTYDNMNRVDLIRENGSTTLADYNYDTLNRRATITRSNGVTTTYTFDNASRLTGLNQNLGGTADNQTLGFAYTAASQISQRTASNDNYNWLGSNASRSYTRNGLNQYTNVGGAAFNYDGRGNLISDGTRNFGYDVENRLAQVTGGSLNFTANYDPLGRVRTTGDGAISVDFLNDGDALVAEYQGSTLLRRYVHGPGVDEPLVWYEGSNLSDRRYLIADHQGSIIAVNGSATTRLSYSPYGEPNTWNGSRFRYTGQTILDPNLATTNPVGIYHYKARVYDPVLGRFLQTDPVGYTYGLNLYSYVRGDPLTRIDPTGLADVNYFSSYDSEVLQTASDDFDLPGVTTVAIHGPVPYLRTGPGPHDWTRVSVAQVMADIRDFGRRGEPIFYGGCRCASANIELISRISRTDGGRPVMAATSQTWWSRNARTGVVTVRAYWRRPSPNDSQADHAHPGEFTVTGGSFADFGIRLAAGETLRGLEYNPATQEATAIVGVMVTGSRIEQEERRPIR